MKNLIVILFFIFFAKLTFSQTSCDNLIEEATDLYNSGRYEECIKMLEGGLKTCSLSKNKKEKTYILLINSNIEKDSLPSVDRYFKLLLLNNPAFKIKDYDGIDDFKEKLNNYYVLPSLSFGARLYYCFLKINVDSAYFLMPDVESKTEYETNNSLNMHFLVNYRITKKLESFSEMGYFKINYDNSAQNSYWKMTVSEKLSYLQWDIGGKYYFNTYNRFNINILAGLSNHFLAASKLDIITTEKKPNNLYNNDPMDYRESINARLKFDSKEIRNHYVPYIVMGSGFLYRFGKFAYGVDFRIYQHLRTINNPQNRINEGLIGPHSYMDSNFSMSRWDISLSAVYMINKVKNKN